MGGNEAGCCSAWRSWSRLTWRVRALRIVSARPAGRAGATVRFTVRVRFTIAGGGG
ncbi:MAG: hypothetical protein ACYCU3_09160 [Streptosporangiaceae bacterium]